MTSSAVKILFHSTATESSFLFPVRNDIIHDVMLASELQRALLLVNLAGLAVEI